MEAKYCEICSDYINSDVFTLNSTTIKSYSVCKNCAKTVLASSKTRMEAIADLRAQANVKNRDAFNRYISVSWSGRELLKKHFLSETGVWKVLGEDPNADLGGYHHQPFLGIFEGKLEDVIRTAVALPNFWQWGGGGSITKIEVTKV